MFISAAAFFHKYILFRLWINQKLCFRFNKLKNYTNTQDHVLMMEMDPCSIAICDKPENNINVNLVQ